MLDSSQEEIMSQAKRLLEEQAEARRTTSAWGGGEGRSYPVGRVSFGPEKPWSEEDSERLVKEFKDGIAEAFERVLNEFCKDLVRQVEKEPHEMSRPQLQSALREVRKHLPHVVERALTEDE